MPGWLLCSGQTVLRTAYPELFAALGTSYNTGGESASLFRLPNLVGRVVVGLDYYSGTTGYANRNSSSGRDVLGGVGGQTTVTLSITQMPTHSHTTGETSHNHGLGAGGEYGTHGHSAGAQNNFTASFRGHFNAAGVGTPWNWSQGNTLVNTGYADVLTSGPPGSYLNYSNDLTGGGAAHENMQPYLTLNAYVKT